MTTISGIAEFLQEAGLVITKTYGDEIVAYCPWHSDRTASLCINPKQGWHCFAGCGKGKYMKSLLQKLEPDRDLYQIFVSQYPMFLLRDDETKEVDDDETKYIIEDLPSAKDNIYLNQRGITNQTIDDFNIRYHVAFNSIIVPIYQNGTLLGSVQRKISGNPRYINSSGMDRDRALFPFDKVQSKDDKIILVEGLFDAIRAHQEGVTNTVCTFGGHVSHTQASLLGSLAKTVVICPDKDASGLKMAYKTTSLLMTFGINVEYTFAPGKAKDFGDVKDFSQLEYHSYWKIKALQRDLKYFMERS